MYAALGRLLIIFAEPSTWLLLLLVVLLLLLSCARSASLSVAQEAFAREAESSLNLWAALGIPLLGCATLLALFYFLNQLLVLLIVLLALAAFTSCTSFVFPTVVALRRRVLPRVADTQHFVLRGAEYDEPVVDLALSGAVAAVVVALWLVTRHWLFVDILGACLASESIKTLRLPSLAVAAGLLLAFFVYDIFWVFVSPMLFGQSVMVQVAVGVSSSAIPLPLLLQIPKIVYSGGAGLLGLGDIVLPGLLLAKLFRIDAGKARTGLRAKNVERALSVFEVLAVDGAYFVPALCAYVVGLVVTLAALALLQMGQPALLYLVPSTLGTTVVLAAVRGELRDMWRGKSDGDALFTSHDDDADDDDDDNMTDADAPHAEV